MTDKYIQDGKTITITAATGGATQGNIYKGTHRGGVYLGTVGGGESVGLALEGVFSLTKKAGATLDFALGEKVAILTTGGVEKAHPYSTGAGATVALGHAIEAAATGATTVKVKLDTF